MLVPGGEDGFNKGFIGEIKNEANQGLNRCLNRCEVYGQSHPHGKKTPSMKVISLCQNRFAFLSHFIRHEGSIDRKPLRGVHKG